MEARNVPSSSAAVSARRLAVEISTGIAEGAEAFVLDWEFLSGIEFDLTDDEDLMVKN